MNVKKPMTFPGEEGETSASRNHTTVKSFSEKSQKNKIVSVVTGPLLPQKLSHAGTLSFEKFLMPN